MKRHCGLLLVVLAILLPACTPSEPAQLGREQVIVGVLGSFSSEGAETAAALLRGVQISVDEYNRSPESSFESRIEQGDTKGTGEGAAEAARQIAAKELLIGVVGPFTLAETLGSGPVLDQAGIPFVIPSVSDISLTEARFARMRRLLADDRQEGSALASDVLKKIGRGAKAAIVHDGSGSGAAFAEGAKQKFEGGGVPSGVLEAAGTVDWNVIAAEILKDPPATVLHGGPEDRAAALIGGLRSAGYKGHFAASRQARGSSFAGIGAAAAGSITNAGCADPNDPALDAFRKTYRARFSGGPGQCAHEAYEATLMLLEAIEEVEPKPQEVAEFFLTARSFLGDTRLYRYAEDGSLMSATVWVYEFRQGGWRFVRRASA